MSRKRLTRKQTTSRPDTLWPEIWKDMSDASKRKEKQKWAIEKPKLDSARRLRGFYFIDLDDEEFKEIMKHARGKLELRCQPHCLASFNVISAGKPVAQFEEHKTKYACIVEADESMRKRMEGSHHENHEDHTKGKGMNSLHKFMPMPQAMKLPDAKAAVDNEREELEKYWHGSWRKSETKMRWSLKHGRTAEMYFFHR